MNSEYFSRKILPLQKNIGIGQYSSLYPDGTDKIIYNASAHISCKKLKFCIAGSAAVVFNDQKSDCFQQCSPAESNTKVSTCKYPDT